MKIQYLNINEHKYRVEYIPHEECSIDESYSASFIMLRNFSLINNIVADDNIYFIEKSIFEQYKQSLVEKTKNEYIVFPSNNDIMYYSSEYHIFNDTYIDNDIVSESCVYEILEKNSYVDDENKVYYKFENNKIQCDLIKIYHPQTIIPKKLIIHIENVINNIHFHYICNTYNWYRKNNRYDSNSEYRYENNIYSEYIKCYIPSIRELFDRNIINTNSYDYKWYFKENLNVIDDISEKNVNFINDIIIKTDSNGYKVDDENKIINQYVPLTLFTQPCSIEEYENDKNNDGHIQPDEKIFKKVYFKYHFSIDNNYITTPLNVSLYPYSTLNASTKIYTITNNFLPATTSILYEYNFTLALTTDFDRNGEMSLLGDFNYPLKEQFELTYDNPLTEAYCFYHHIINRNNIYISNMKESYYEELDEINSIDDIDDETIKLLIDSNAAERYPKLTNQTKKQYYIEKLKESRWQVFLEEYMNEFKANIDFFGFMIEIASDKYFKHIILSKNISLLDLTTIDLMDFLNEHNNDMFYLLGNGKFFFNLKGIFTNWKQLPDIVVARITFIDRFIGNEIQSNEIFISKEKFKYIAEVKEFTRLDQLTALNKDMIELNLNNQQQISESFNTIVNKIDNEDVKNELIDWYINNPIQYSFINKINCIVSKENDVNQLNQLTGVNKNKNTQIIYKPIFFKTSTLNNVQLKYMQNQNIGIDLHEYLSKVNLFIMTLGGNTYTEIGRNSNYVLFNINAATITDEYGSFEIYNDDHEYITYGSWSIVR